MYCFISFDYKRVPRPLSCIKGSEKGGEGTRSDGMGRSLEEKRKMRGEADERKPNGDEPFLCKIP